MVRATKRSLAATAAAAACILLAQAAPALADEPPHGDPARLASLLRSGEAAAKSGKWEACAQAYSEALAIKEAARTAGELGLCEEQLGRFADAHRHLDRAMDAAPTDPAAEPWKRYQAAMVRVRSRVAILFITVAPPDAAVVLDGHPIGRADGRGVAVEPGTHTIAARLRGHEDALKTISVVAPSAPHIDLALTAIPAPASTPSLHADRTRPVAPAPPPASPSGEPGQSGNPLRAPALPPAEPWYVPASTARGGFVLLAGVSLVTALSSGTASIVVEVERADLRSKLSFGACGPSAASRPLACDELAERYQERNVLLGMAIGSSIAAGLFAGAARIAFDVEKGATTPQVAPMANPNGGGIVVLGVW